MTTCHWCGDLHAADRLCVRGQRSLTRRSFCFLFGSGIAGVFTATSLAQAALRGAPPITLGSEPFKATFETMTFRPVLGQEITITFDGRVFCGVIEDTTVLPGGISRVHARSPLASRAGQTFDTFPQTLQ